MNLTKLQLLVKFQEKQICDWPKNAQCKTGPTTSKPVVTEPIPEPTQTVTNHPIEEATPKPTQPGTLPDLPNKPDLLNC